MDWLKRGAAPLQDASWEAIDAEAARLFRSRLVGRRVVDVTGPLGWQKAAINLGHLDVLHEEDDGERRKVRTGLRSVLPLTELRASFNLDVWSLDDVARGASDPDIDPLVETALAVAEFEDLAIFQGYASGGIGGILGECANDPVELGKDPSGFPERIARAVLDLVDAGIGGPYALVLGREPFAGLEALGRGYPPRREVEKQLGGPVLYSPVVEGGVLLSMRGGDFELTLGSDLAIGYEAHDAKTVRLFITESFTFRVLEPKAAIPLR